MKLSIFFVSIYVSIAAVSAKIDPKNLRCLVCRTTFDELNKVILKVDKWKKVDVGNFRMDADGNTMQQKVPAHRSDVYISELIEDVCKKLNDYVRVYYKSTGKLAIMQLMSDGHMNPEFSKTKFVTDDDLNKSLEYYCERMFEDNEEEILSMYKNRPHDDEMPDAQTDICFKHAGFCEDWMLPNEEDTTWTPQMEAEYVKIHGPDPYGFGMAPPAMPAPVEEEYDEEMSRHEAEDLGSEFDSKDEL